jgi:hypothetical protein
VRLTAGFDEAGLLIEVAGGEQVLLGPEHDFAVAGGSCELDAFGDELAADA